MITSPLLSTPMIKAPRTVPEDRAFAARQRGTPDHHGCDGIEFESLAGNGRSGVQSRCHNQPADRRQSACDRIDQELDVSDVDAGEFGGHLVASHGVDIPPEPCFLEQHGSRHHNPGRDPHLIRHTQQAPRSDAHERVSQTRDCFAARV